MSKTACSRGWNEWVTTGRYKVLKIYDPQYQEEFTRKDLPPSLSYFV